jgi:hypothetical protein
MTRIVAFVFAVLACSTCAFGTQIISRGAPFGLYIHGGKGPLFSLTLGYSEELNEDPDPSTMIGNTVWFSGPGAYDVSNDPDFAGFLEWAADGRNDYAIVSLIDQSGTIMVAQIGEGDLLGTFPDLTGLPVTGAIMDILAVTSSEVVFRWEFLGTPEPTTVLLFGASCALIPMRARKTRRSRCCERS